MLGRGYPDVAFLSNDLEIVVNGVVLDMAFYIVSTLSLSLSLSLTCIRTNTYMRMYISIYIRTYIHTCVFLHNFASLANYEDCEHF